MTGTTGRTVPVAVAVSLSDQTLLARARAGDQGAFHALVRRYEGTVARVAIGMLGPGPDADDVGQETMLKLHASLERFRGDAGLGTYLTRIAINLALRTLQRRRTWMQRFLRLDPQDPPRDPPAQDRPDAALERGELSKLVGDALLQLAPDERAVVVLRLVQELSTRETAAFLRIPEGTVMSRLSRALARLRPLLDSHGGAMLLREDPAHE